MPLPTNAVLDELKQAPIREILGVVDALGAAVSRVREQPWTVRIVFNHWKLQADLLVTHRLTLRKQFVSFEETKPVCGLAQPHKVLRVRAHILDGGLLNVSDGLFVEVVGGDGSDVELNSIARQLQEPVTFEDDVFGTLCLDRRMKSYDGSATWCSKPVQLRLRVGDDPDPRAALEAARQIWGAEQQWNQRICDFAVLQLLDLSNDWRQSGDEAITDEVFRKRIDLFEVTVFPDGSFEYWFDAGGMFTDHAVRVSGNLLDGPAFAGIEG